MASGETSADMAAVASRYQTQLTIAATNGTPYQRILEANPRRLYVKFMIQGFVAATYPLVPGPPNPALITGGITLLDAEYKFRDCPSIVAGEWYVGAAAGANILIVECVYVD